MRGLGTGGAVCKRARPREGVPRGPVGGLARGGTPEDVLKGKAGHKLEAFTEYFTEI